MRNNELTNEIESDIYKVKELVPIVMISITDASGRFESIFPFLTKEEIIEALEKKKTEIEYNV